MLSATAQTYLVLDGGTVNIGQSTGFGSGSGSPLLMFNLGSTAGTVNVFSSATTSSLTYYPPVLVKGTHASFAVNCSNGTVGVAALPGETATGTFKTTGGDLVLGAGTTITAVNGTGGTILNHTDNTITAATISGATYDYDGTGTHTLLNNYSGTVNYNGSGTATALNNWGTVDFSGDPRAKTVTNSSQYSGATLNVDNGTPGGIIFTNAIQYPDGIGNVTIVSPRGVKGTLTNI